MKFKNTKKTASSQKAPNSSMTTISKTTKQKITKKVLPEKVEQKKIPEKKAIRREEDTGHFPKNFRFITERKFWLILLLLLAIISLAMIGVDIYVHKQALSAVEEQRQELLQKEQYWIGVTKEKPDYRDGYIEVALYAYQLQDKKTALENIQKALVLDPNSSRGIQIREVIEKM